ncbi:MAG: DNA polymerase I [Candidatus Bipolaricaulota bacterium]
MSTYEDVLRLPRPLDASRLLLLDGHSHAYRAFYAVRGLSAADGTPVNALFGFWRALLATLRTYPSAYVAVVFDAEGKTFRHDLWEGYKATRAAMPEDLARQLPLLGELLTALGISCISRQGVEADDVLASLASQGARDGLSCLISTSDKDMAQLVGGRVALLRPASRGEEGDHVLDADGVTARYGVRPDQMVDLLSLVGDASDNVPGVPAVGEKTAVRLLQEFGSLDALLARAEEVANPRIRDTLLRHVDVARAAQQLVRLRLDLDLGDVRQTCRLRGIDEGALHQFLTRVGFASALRELALDASAARVAAPPNPDVGVACDYRAVLDAEGLREVIDRLRRAERVSVDLETSSLDPLTARIVGVAVSAEPYVGFYIPVGHDALDAPPQLPLEQVLEELRPLLEDESVPIIGQNLKFDLSVLESHGIVVRGMVFDSMVASYLLRPEDRRHGLDAVARAFLGVETSTFAEVAGKDGSFAAVPLSQATQYAAEDAELVQRLYPLLVRKLDEAALTPLFRDVEMPLVEVLARMERNGVLLDVAELARQGVGLREDLARIEADLFDIAGGPFNPNSTKQVADILFERLHLPVLERTKTGPSTSAEVLAQLAVAHPLPGKLLAYREISKLLSTYVEQLALAVHPQTGRIHTSFHQTSTATGRLSSSDPNLQNIPTRTEVGGRIRRAFVAPPQGLLLGADYSQIELRLLAHLSGDRNLVSALASGEDLHRATAARVFGVPDASVTPVQREAAKRINFGILYGISSYGLGKQLGIPAKEAGAYIERFFTAYPEVRAFIDARVDRATEVGYAETLLGRRRPLPNLGSRSPALRNADRRNAVNMPIQGSAADLIKLAMLDADRRIARSGLRAKMILQIHDELVFEVHENDAEGLSALVREAMEGVLELRVPLQVKLSIGRSWDEI